MSFYVNEPEMVLYDWLASRIGISWSTDFRALGRVVDDKLIGVVGYNAFTETSCQMHMAGDKGWMTHEFVCRMFRYPFVEMGLLVVIGVVEGNNTHALQLYERLGTRSVVVIPDAHPNGGLHLVQMRREWCRWIQGRKHHGQKQRQAAEAA